MQATTPLGKDALLLIGLNGSEAISQLFSFQLDLLAENASTIAFDKLLGQRVTARFEMSDVPKRYFNGIVVRVSEGARDETFTAYQLEIVPQLWLLTRKAQSRIFQHITVPNILKKVFTGLDVKFQLQGTYPERDYCVQYRETDFDFASRLMEEEGIFYFFEHTADGHQMLVADEPLIHPELPEQSTIIYDSLQGGLQEEGCIYDWAKVQELRSGKSLLWDHCFELPHKHLEADKEIQDSIQAGDVTHKLKVGGNDKLELYDYPGEYAQRFDGISPSGGEQAADIQKIFQENSRTVGIRMQQEAFPSLRIQGASSCLHLISGHKFTLDRHFNADGQYLLTSVQHTAALDAYRSDQGAFTYSNSFTCTPVALPFRPLRVTPRPFIQGSQTAVVVGPSGEEIFTDKYGRVKVQFHWDRDGQHNANSSCWIRVATSWAGKKWGVFHIPRIGQEVVVDFLEGDPDSPIIVGSVYNAEQMSPYTLPDEKTKSGIKSCSTKGGGGFNEIRLEDKKGEEQIFIHGEKDMDVRVKKDVREFIGQNMGLTIEKDQDIAIKGIKKETITGASHLHVKDARNEKVEMNQSLTVGMNQQEKVGMKHALEAGMQIHLKAGVSVVIEAGVQLSLKVGGSFIDINPAGVFIQGPMVMINSGGAAGAGSGSSPTAPTDANPAKAAEAKPGSPSGPAHH